MGILRRIAEMLRRRRCEFAGVCELYRADSYTCNHGGGPYCGRWRALKERKAWELCENFIVDHDEKQDYDVDYD